MVAKDFERCSGWIIWAAGSQNTGDTAVDVVYAINTGLLSLSQCWG